MTAQKMDEILKTIEALKIEDDYGDMVYADVDGVEIEEELIGVRFQDVDTNEVGDVINHLSTNFEREYEDTGVTLNGVSAIALKDFMTGAYIHADDVYGNKVAYVIYSEKGYEWGMDEAEVILADAKVLAKIIL